MKLILLFFAFSIAAFAQNSKPCTNVQNTAVSGQVLSAAGGGSTPPCRWVNNGSGGGGTMGSVTIGGTAGQITVTGTCSSSTTINCTVSIPSNAALPGSPTTTTQVSTDNSTKIATTAFVQSALPTSLPPSGTAGGDLSGSYPNPTVAKVDGVSYGASPSTNTVPVVTGANTVTYEAVPNAALANSATTVNGQTCTLGSTCTVTGAPSGTAGGDLSGSYPNPTVAKVNGVSYSASPSTHQTPIVTAPNVTTYKTIPDCTDTGGNHLNYTQSSDAYSCGTSSGGASITSGTMSSLPATCTHSSTQSDLYYTTDSIYDYLCTATDTWQARYQGSFVGVPSPAQNVSEWTGVNLTGGTTATVSGTGGPLSFTFPSTASLQWKGESIAMPSTPYRVITRMRIANVFVNANTVGTYFYDGTKLYGLEALLLASTNMTFRVEKITNVTTDGSTAASQSGPNFFTGDVFVCLSDDGSSLRFDWSLDRTTWHNLFSESVGTYMTPTKILLGGVNDATTLTVYPSFLEYTTGTAACP